MDIPTYLKSPDYAKQETFMQEMFQTLLDGLGPTGFQVTNQTSAGITALIDKSATPILPVGTTWFNTDISKLVVLVTAAVPPGPFIPGSNGVTETVTST
jgi:hypothetical protein